MQSSTVNLNVKIRAARRAEMTTFINNVRPAYADMCMDFWEVVCVPILRLGSYFQRKNTARFIASYEVEENRKKNLLRLAEEAKLLIGRVE